MSVSCGGEQVGAFSGYGLALGSEMQGEDMGAHPMALAALVMAIVGLGVGFWKDSKSNMIAGIAGIAGFITLLLLKAGINKEAASPEYYGIQVNWEGAYYLALLLFIAAAAVNIVLAMGLKTPSVSALSGEGGEYKYCSNCGARNPLNNTFCVQCGARCNGEGIE